jgi:chloramphenicol 3-O-phosphotransferase
MIVMINGSFGVGKTSVAEALAQRWAHAMIFDPEILGGMVRLITNGVRYPHENTEDFQDIAIWRTLTIATAEQLYAQYRRPLIVPMTLANVAYFREIKAGFEQIATPVLHVCLVASLPTIQQRLLSRGDLEGGWSWRMAKRCVVALHGPEFEAYIDVEQLTIDQIAEHILDRMRGRSIA